jgi:hypothetical protein
MLVVGMVVTSITSLLGNQATNQLTETFKLARNIIIGIQLQV